MAYLPDWADTSEKEEWLRAPVQGFRRPIADALIRNCPTVSARRAEDRRLRDAARAGFLSALYVLRAESLPPAYVRSEDVANFQAEVNYALSVLSEGRQ